MRYILGFPIPARNTFSLLNIELFSLCEFKT